MKLSKTKNSACSTTSPFASSFTIAFALRRASFLLVLSTFLQVANNSAFAVKFHKVAEEGTLVPQSPNQIYGRLGVPSINSYGVNGRHNLAVDHALNAPNSLGDGVLSFANCQGDCDPGGYTFFPNPSFGQLKYPSAGNTVHRQASLLTNTPTPQIPSDYASLAPSPGSIFIGAPIAEGLQVTFAETTSIGTSLGTGIVIHDLQTGIRSPIVAPTEGFNYIGSGQFGSQTDLGVSNTGGSVVFRGHNHQPNSPNNGIVRRTFTRNLNGTVSPSLSFEHIAISNDTADDGQLFQYSAPAAYESQPVSHGRGAVWSYSTNNSASGDNVYYGHGRLLANPGNPSSVQHTALANRRTTPNGIGYGDVAADGFGHVFFEEIHSSGDTTLGMSIQGVYYPQYITPAMVPAGNSQYTVGKLDIGHQAMLTHTNPFSARVGATLTFHAGLNTAGPKVNDAVFVTDIPEFSIDASGKFGGPNVEDARLSEAIFYPQCASPLDCVDRDGPADHGGMWIRGLDPSGERVPLGQNYGHSLGVNNPSADNYSHLVDQREALLLKTAHDTLFDTLVLTDFGPDDELRLKVDSLELEMRLGYSSVSTENVVDGLFAMELDLDIPAGSEVMLEHLRGDGWGLSGVILQTSSALGKSGDFDGDFDIDGQDYLGWQRGDSPEALSAEDLLAWQNNYAGGDTSVQSSLQAVPEPATFGLLGVALAANCCLRLRERTGR